MKIVMYMCDFLPQPWANTVYYTVCIITSGVCHDLLLKLCVKKGLEKGKMSGGILLGCCRDYSGLTTYGSFDI